MSIVVWTRPGVNVCDRTRIVGGRVDSELCGSAGCVSVADVAVAGYWLPWVGHRVIRMNAKTRNAYNQLTF